MAGQLPLKTSFTDGAALPASDLNDITNALADDTTYPDQLAPKASDGRRRPIPYAMSAGTRTFSSIGSLAAGASVSATVTFSTNNRFIHTPIIVATIANNPANSARLTVRVENESITGFDVTVTNVSASALPGPVTNLDINWIALNMTYATADNS